jgi:putative peptide zinc metalloprotease protein
MQNFTQDQQTEPTEPDTSWLGRPLALSPDVERLTGANFQPMLYLESGQRYIRLSRGAAGLLDALDGITTAEQILARVKSCGDPLVEARRRQVVLQAIDGLRRAGAFTLDRGDEAKDQQPRWRRWAAGPPRLRVTRGIDGLIARPAGVAARHRRAVGLALVVLVLAGVAVCIAGACGFSPPSAVLWPAVFGVVLVEVAVHELAHAAACKVFGVRVREAGIMLWGWFLPLAYVDCTDTYRLPAKRPRVLVALAGPYVDLVAAAACAVVMLAAHGELAGTASIIFLSLLLMLARNLTPLLPTDGYHALEAVTGQLNLRRRAWSQLRAWSTSRVPGVRRGAAESPAASMTRWQTAYIAYGIASVLYTIATFALVVLEVHELARIL